MTNFTVIGAATTRAARAIWMLEELGVPYEHINAKPREAQVTQHYARGKVPVLLVDGAPITDSTAIVQFLADHHGKLTHAPGTVERARQDALMQCVLDELDAVLWMAARHSFILPEEQRVPAVKDSLKWEFARNLESLSQRIGTGPWVMGDTFTVADIVLGHCLLWAIAAKFPVEDAGMRAYFDRIKAREAFQKTVAMRG
jgi:glutathione S-transferase